MLNETDRNNIGKFRRDQDPVKSGLARAYHEIVGTWIKLYGDIPFPEAARARKAQSVPVLEDQSPTPRDLLNQIVAEARKGIRTPELFTDYWRLKFQVDGVKAGVNIEIPACDWTKEEIQRPMVDKLGNKIHGLMVPDLEEITLPFLGRIYPKMGSYTVAEDSLVTETHYTRGWIKVYDAVDAPNRNTAKSDAERFIEKQGYLPGREKGYILGSQASKDFNGKYFDQGETWSWLLGSRVGGEVVRAYFGPDGFLDAGWDLSDPGVLSQYDGWRFEEVKRA